MMPHEQHIRGISFPGERARHFHSKVVILQVSSPTKLKLILSEEYARKGKKWSCC